MEGSKFGRALVAGSEAISAAVNAVAKAQEKAHVVMAREVNKAADVGKAEKLATKDIVAGVAEFIFRPAVQVGLMKESSFNNYKSGLGKALKAGVAWSASSHIELDKKGTAKPEKGRKAKAKPATRPATIGTVKVNRRGRILELKLATSTDLDAFTQAVTAVQSEPGRIALFLAYVKAQGWTE